MTTIVYILWVVLVEKTDTNQAMLREDDYRPIKRRYIA